MSNTRTYNVGAKLGVILLHSKLLHWRYHHAAAVHAISLASDARAQRVCTEPSHSRIIDKNV